MPPGRHSIEKPNLPPVLKFQQLICVTEVGLGAASASARRNDEDLATRFLSSSVERKNFPQK